MAKRVWSFGIVSVALLALGATLLSTAALEDPGTGAGVALFRWEYGRSSDKAVYLDTFRKRLWKYEGGYIPSPVAQFLNSKLESSTDNREVSAVAQFYSLQAGGREPAALFDLSDEARKRLARTVLSEWRSYPSQSAQGGFILLEGLRQNTYVGKANVLLPHGWADSKEKLAPVATLFEKWNTKYASTPFTKRPNPLQGTPYSIEAP